MLNISQNSISDKIDRSKYSTLSKVEAKVTRRVLLRMIKWGFFILFAVALMPWTQNVRSAGQVITLKPDQRPQMVNSVIAGRVEQWHVQEGDFVEKGDTIAVISEIKDAYFDQELLDRTKNQLELKKRTVEAYGTKGQAQERQMEALTAQQRLELEQAEIKLQQARLKVQNDSITYEAAKLDYKTAAYQYDRMDSLYTLGLKSLTDLEKRRIKRQQAKAKEVEARNYWENSKNELNNLRLQLDNIRVKFGNAYAKTLSERMTTETNRFDAESTVNKLENQYRNYEVRKGFHVITAPQSGYITHVYLQGIGETIKEGQQVVSIMPKDYELAAEIYVDPLDLPLMHLGEKVRVQFDGWPAIVFSGWPNASYGTYGGEIYAVDRYISENGKYRVLIKPDKNDHQWPEALRFGGGVKAMILLNDVPVWYELWRKINGFPPEFYQPQKKQQTEEKKVK